MKMSDTGIDEEIQEKYGKQLEQLEEFEKKKAEIRVAEKKLPAIYQTIKRLPYPNQFITLVLGLVLVGLYIKYGHMTGDFILSGWKMEPNIEKNMTIALAMTTAGLFGILFFILVMTKSITFTWLRAVIFKKPVLIWFTKNKTVEFRIPLEVTHDMWDVDEESAVLPESDAIYTGPHKVSMMAGVPDVGVGVDLRGLVRKQPINFDSTTVKMYAKAHEQRAYKDMRTGLDAFKPFVMPLIILIVIGLIFVPVADKRLDQSGSIEDYQDQVVKCRMKLADNGINPESGVRFADPVVASEKPGPASTGAGFK